MRLFKLTFLVCSACFLSQLAFAQNEQTAYLSAKHHYSVGSFKLAMEGFKKLSDPNANHDFIEYASFYYGLSAFKNGDLGLARSIWLQIEKKYPKWNKISEVNFWLSNVYFEEGNYNRGVYYAKKSSYNQEQKLIEQYISEVTDIKPLSELNKQYPKDKIIATFFANSIIRQPFGLRDNARLKSLINKFEFDQSLFGMPEIGISIKREKYNVAVLLPFMFSGLEDVNRISRNKFVLDLYEGILTAADTLNSAKVVVNVFPYDTKRNIYTTDSILQKDELRNMDLIVGPLFPDPSKLVSDFCFEQKINMINPVSTNDKVINDNPYSFLFKPSNQTIASSMANYTISNVENKNTYIFFDETEKDSLTAYTYKSIIESKDFEVIHCSKVNAEKIGEVHALLTEIYEVALTQEEADSLLLIDEVLVKERKIKLKDEEEDSIFYYQEFFSIAPDSIGHIFVSSSKPLHASSFISSVEIRPDTVPLLTNGPWMNYDMLTIDQLQRLEVKFAYPDYINFEKESVKSFRKTIRIKYKKEPSLNNYIGYDLLYYVGEMMRTNGHYFQKGALRSGRVNGQIFEGFEYNIYNSNQVVPIVTFDNTGLKNIIEE